MKSSIGRAFENLKFIAWSCGKTLIPVGIYTVAYTYFTISLRSIDS